MPLPVISVAQMREWEKATWASGGSELEVMRQAGRVVARRAEQLTRPGDMVLVMAGRGHNGDDASFAAEQMAGRQSRVVRVSDPEAAVTEIEPLLEQQPALLIDGLFGIGLNRPLAANWIELIRRLNQAGIPILALDVPSGLNADTGEPMEDAIRAAHTVTLGAVKQGLLKSASWPFVGRLQVAPDIGLIPYPFPTEIRWTVAEDFHHFPPGRLMAGHKGTFGHLGLIAGSLGYHGAAVLAARGAQRAQAGLITVLTMEDTYVPVASQLQAVMVRPWKSGASIPDSCTALAVGPGLAAEDVPEGLRSAVARLWAESGLPMVLDASALDWLPEGACPQDSLRVITPHPGEAARLLSSSAARVLSDRPWSVRELSRRWGNCWVVLKGHQTMLGRAKEELYVNSSGNPGLAQGGSGDLLTGYLGGLLAQPGLQADPLQAVRYAVWQHGAAADLLQACRPGWTVENLAEALGSVVPHKAG